MLNVDAFSEDNFVKSKLRGDIRLELASPEIRYSAGFNQDLCLFSHSFLARCRFYAFLSSCFARGRVRRWVDCGRGRFQYYDARIEGALRKITTKASL